jgi:hypothetical protein
MLSAHRFSAALDRRGAQQCVLHREGYERHKPGLPVQGGSQRRGEIHRKIIEKEKLGHDILVKEAQLSKEKNAMSYSGLDQARQSLQQLAQRTDLDGTIRQHLDTLARGLQETDQRLKAIEVLIEQLAVNGNIRSSSDIVGSNKADWNYLGPLLGHNRA